ncbi:AraC family transcriptional regulator [Negadavirga shengliensis]|uniref:AraC family transcriptional regulator n=1 Tax=Negadavirga shengliensis TaxID=1389218 RepID=A0ABV9T7M8_9BACT
MKVHDISDTSERVIVNLKKMGFRNIQLIGRYIYSGARQQLDTHVHPGVMEICYCDKGQQVYEVGTQNFLIKGGDVFVTFPDEPHSTADHPEEKGILYWLQIALPSECEYFLGYNGQDARSITDALLNLPARHFKGNSDLKRMLRLLMTLLNQPSKGLNRLRIYNILTSFLLSIINSSRESNKKVRANDRVKSVQNFITSHLDESLSISVLANQQNLSESHFKSWFKREVGITPMDYVLRQKIEKAKQLISERPFTTMTAVAYQLNFSSSQHFSSVFKKYTGMTPVTYKKISLAT